MIFGTPVCVCGVRKFISLGILFFCTSSQAAIDLVEAWATTGLKLENLKIYYTTEKCYESLKHFYSCIEATNAVLSQLEPTAYIFPEDVLVKKQLILTDYSKKFGSAHIVHPDLNISVPAHLLASYQVQQNDRAEFMEYWKNAFLMSSQEKGVSEKVNFDGILEWLKRYFKDSYNESFVTGLGLNGYTRSFYDPHTEYIPADLTAQMGNNKNLAEYVGIGISVDFYKNKYVIRSVLEGGPAAQAGIQEKDIILDVTVNGKKNPVEKFNLDSLIEALRGLPRTEVSVTVLRKQEKLLFKMLRAPVPLRVVSSRIIQDPQPVSDFKIGYLKINEMRLDPKIFLNEYVMSLARIHGKEAKQIILDLRGNVGGFLKNVESVVDFLIPTELDLFRENQGQFFKSSSIGANYFSSDLPLIILTDSKTASSAEIIAGILQEYSDTQSLPYFIVGERTQGKGNYQSFIQHELGSAFDNKVLFKATKGLIYLPSNRTHQIDGITPDFETFDKPHPSEIEKFKMREENYFLNHLPNPHSVKWFRSDSSQTQVNAIQECLKAEGLAEKIFEKESEILVPDYQLLVAFDVLRCVKKLGIKSKNPATPTQLLQEVWTKYRTRLD